MPLDTPVRTLPPCVSTRPDPKIPHLPLSGAGIQPFSFLALPQALGAPLSHSRDAVSLRFPSTWES